MSDKLLQTLTGRVFKEPVVSEKAIRVEVVSNLYQKSEDPQNNTHPVYTTIVLTGNLIKLWGGRVGEIVKGSRVFASGEWNFSLFMKKDGTPGLSCSIFPSIFEVNPPRVRTPPATDSTTTSPAAQEDDLPF